MLESYEVLSDLSGVKPEKQQKTNVSLPTKNRVSISMNCRVSYLSLHLFFCCFISLKSVGTKEMTILHNFLTFLTVSQTKMYYGVG